MNLFEIRVLVVDDFAFMRSVVTKHLKELGFSNIDEAGDGNIAYLKLMEGVNSKTPNPYTLVLSDWNMPNLSGLDFLKKVRATEAVKGVKFVMITAEAEMGSVKEAIEAGVSSYILKPFTRDDLWKKIKATFGIKD